MWLAKAFRCGDAALVAALTNSPNGEPRSGLAKILPLLGGPQNAERSSLDGHQTGGGLGTTFLAENVSCWEPESWRPWEGNPLGRGEGELRLHDRKCQRLVRLCS